MLAGVWTTPVVARALMVGERCVKCKRQYGYRKCRPEERLNGRFRPLFQMGNCPACGFTAIETWAVWWNVPVVV